MLIGMATIEARKNRAGEITSYRVEWYENGARKRQSMDTKDQATMWKSMLEAAKGDSAIAERNLLRTLSSAPTLLSVAEKHLDRLIGSTPYTIQTYRGYMRNHFGTIGHIPIDRITDADMIAWVRMMQDAGKSHKTIGNVHGFIHGVFGTAVRLKLRDDNPAQGYRLPRDNATEDEIQFITMHEFRMIEAHLGEDVRPLFRLLIGGGLRLGEATALTAADIFLDAIPPNPPSVRVTKAWKEDREKGTYVGPPKSRNSIRTVSLPPSVVDAIRETVESASAAERVFVPRTLSKSGHRAIQWRWSRAVKKAQRVDGLVKSPRIHDLRHSHASLMIQAGIELLTLSRRLGHESVLVTTKVYGHLFPESQFAAADAAQRALT